MSVGLLILRLVVGLGLAAHGAQKLRPRRPGLAELLGGLFLGAGFLTPAAAAAVVAVLLVAGLIGGAIPLAARKAPRPAPEAAPAHEAA